MLTIVSQLPNGQPVDEKTEGVVIHRKWTPPVNPLGVPIDG
jgi:hypothetical protein